MKLRDKYIIMSYYKSYYHLNYKKIYKSIKDAESREFALINHEGVMKRHLAIPSIDYFEKIVKREEPRDLYHSSSYYLFPEKPMGQKEWQAADLIFDIDADHIPRIPIKKIYRCKKCGEIYNIMIDKCEKCGGDVEEVTIIDSESLEKIKNELYRLIDVLNNDIGVPIKDMEIYFSGARGYHIHVSKEPYINMEGLDRLEIKDYITFEGIDIKFVYDPDSRAVVELKKFLEKIGPEYEKFFSDDEWREIQELVKAKNKMEFLDGIKKKIINKRKSIIEKINKIISKEIGIGIDGIVTVDTSRLIRAPYSIHGKTGLIKKEIPYEKLDETDVIEHSKLEEEDVYIHVRYIPSIVWGGKEFSETFDERLKLPINLAIYLLNKGLGYDIQRV